MPVTRIGSVRTWRGRGEAYAEDQIAQEVPVALTYNRTAHVVMMASPADLEDFGLGFSLTEGIVSDPGELLSTRVIPRDQGLELAMTVTEPCFGRLSDQRRNLTGRTGCGLCGAESLEHAMRGPRPVTHRLQVTDAALQAAVAELESHQPMQARTGAVHGAAWCDSSGRVERVREDVGRHNALDKLIGSLFRSGFEPTRGFFLVSSRASYEMVYKAAAAGGELLLAVSAPTSLAVQFAERSGLTLVGFARPGRHNVYTFPERVSGPAGRQDDV